MLSSFLFNMNNVSEKSCRESQNTHFIFNNFFLKTCHLWGTMEIYDRARQATDDNIIQRMRIACWITKTTGTHSEYIIHTDFPLQQCLHIHTLPVLLLISCVECCRNWCEGCSIWHRLSKDTSTFQEDKREDQLDNRENIRWWSWSWNICSWSNCFKSGVSGLCAWCRAAYLQGLHK